MARNTTLLSLTAALGLAACAAAEINQPPVQYTPTKQLNAVGSSSFVVRTFVQSAGRRSEVSGVACSFAGDGFKSSFTSPAVVVSPNLQGRTPPASVTCSYEGESRTQTILPYNETLENINSNTMAVGANAGLVGILVGGAVAAAQASARDTAQDVYGYPDVDIVFKR